MNLKNKKVLVTGANGYIGHNVVKKLLDEGATVIATYRNSKDNIDERAICKNIDLFQEDVDFYNELEKPDIVLHMAWRDGFNHKSVNHIRDLYYHYNLLSNLIDNDVKQIAVIGSMHEIGFYEGKVDENTPTKPMSYYGIAKNTLRQLLEVKQKEKDFCLQWIRCYYLYGDDINNHSIFSKIIAAEKEGKETFPFTTGTNKYDFTHIDTLSEYICAIISQTEIDGIIECCSGEPISLKDKVESFLEDNKFNIKLQYGVFPERPYDSKIIYGDNTKMNKILCKKRTR